jgi:hypothetical protein
MVAQREFFETNASGTRNGVMTIERGLRAVAGFVVTASVAMAVLHSPWWLALTGFAGLNLLQSAFTNWCPMVWILQRAGLRPCTADSRV